MRACQLKNEIYEPKKMEAVYQNIVARSKTETPQFYEIRVDDFPVVEKTCDPERFMNYAEFVDANTKHISVFLYYSNRNASDKLFFHLQPNQFTNSTSLNGIPNKENPFEQEKNQKEQWRKDLHYEQLLEENQELKQEIEELERTIELIEEEKENIKEKRDLDVMGYVKLGLEGAVQTKIARKIFPFLGDLSGVPEQNVQSNQETQNSFKRKSTSNQETEDVESEEVESPALNEEEKVMFATLLDIKNRVGNIELRNVFHLVDMVTQNPHSIHFAIKQVSNYLKQRPTPKQAETDSTVNETEPNF